MVQAYYDLGVRSMLLTYNGENQAGFGCHAANDTGLTSFGRGVVDEMNRVGMMVDVSHCGYRTSMDALECSASPVIFSHSSMRAVWDHERNIRDDQARACAATGGVIGINGVGIFLGDNDISVQADGAAHRLCRGAGRSSARRHRDRLCLRQRRPQSRAGRITRRSSRRPTVAAPVASTSFGRSSSCRSRPRSSAVATRLPTLPPLWAATSCAWPGRYGSPGRSQPGQRPEGAAMTSTLAGPGPGSSRQG